MDVKIEPTAHIGDKVQLGPHTRIWDNVHIRENATIGHHTIIGEKSYIAYEVIVGNFVKINAMVYICNGVTIEDMCMISAGAIFTNDTFPRSMNSQLTELETSDPTEKTLATLVQRGCTIGANATIGPGVTLGEFSMVGMGAVVTADVPRQALVIGIPAKVVGYVCICGPKIMNLNNVPVEGSEIVCSECQRKYLWKDQNLIPLEKEIYDS